MLALTLLAHFLATGFSLMLTRRGPRRLRWLSLVVGLMSMTQTMAFLHRNGMMHDGPTAQFLADIHEGLVAVLCVWAIVLLAYETLERKWLDMKIRLLER